MKIKQVFDIEISEGIEDVVDELDEEYIVLEGELYPVSSNPEDGMYWRE